MSRFFDTSIIQRIVILAFNKIGNFYNLEVLNFLWNSHPQRDLIDFKAILSEISEDGRACSIFNWLWDKWSVKDFEFLDNIFLKCCSRGYVKYAEFFKQSFPNRYQVTIITTSHLEYYHGYERVLKQEFQNTIS